MTLYPLAVYLTIVTSLDNDFTKSSPDYLLEKSHILILDERDGWGFGYLDYKNMRRAVNYLKLWKQEVPETWVKELALQEQAAEEWNREVQADYD